MFFIVLGKKAFYIRVCVCKCLVVVLLCNAMCHSYFVNYLAEEERVDCFAYLLYTLCPF